MNLLKLKFIDQKKLYLKHKTSTKQTQNNSGFNKNSSESELKLCSAAELNFAVTKIPAKHKKVKTTK